jgi:histidine phosphotransferase ChpT
MKFVTDLRVTELLCAHLCHELVSPVGAISNGVEMIAEFEGDADTDVLGLIGDSAKITAQRLQFYRVAYGGGGTVALRTENDLRKLAEGLMESGRATIKWGSESLVSTLQEAHVRLLLNLLPLGSDTLPRGGELSVGVTGRGMLSVMATGEGARISPEVETALQQDVSIDDLTPRSVHAYYCQCLARRLGTTVQASVRDIDCVEFSSIL